MARTIMQTYKIEATLDQDGSLTLHCLPFRAGEKVEVVIFPAARNPDPQRAYPLRGTPYRYDEPTLPVAETDWEAVR
jgi:hypothetical protein